MKLYKLKELRKNKKISQEEMARTLNISLRSYQMKESGKNEFLFKEVVNIAEKMNMDVCAFLKEVM